MSPRDLGLAEDGPESGDDLGMQGPRRPEGEPRDGMQEQIQMRLSRESRLSMYFVLTEIISERVAGDVTLSDVG